jgi:TRAP-type mannitol/chloroaromatic compound transport system permease small subunit
MGVNVPRGAAPPPTVIDGLSTAAGWLAGWLIVPMTFAVAYEVAARDIFGAPTKWTYEVGYMTYGAQLMLAAGYTLLKGGHIRTDVFYERWSAKTRATGDAICYLFFFFPGLLLILYAGAVEAWFAWEIGERTALRIGSVPWPMYPFTRRWRSSASWRRRPWSRRDTARGSRPGPSPPPAASAS